MASILLDRGESKKLIITVNGNISADKNRVHIAQDGITALKYTSETPLPTGYKALISSVYTSSTNTTAVTVHIEASDSASLSVGSADIAIWTSKTEAGFSEEYQRFSSSTTKIKVRETF